MDKEALQRQLEDMEEASERWRAERRRLNAEIEKLETALSDVKAEATRKRSADKSQAADPRSIARLQEAAEQKLTKAAGEWESERTKLNSKINRLEGALAEAIARASNPLRMTQSVKEQFELEMTRVAKEKTEVEQAFLRARTEWEQEKLKMTGEVVKLRRTAQIMGRPIPAENMPETNPKVRDLQTQLKENLAQWNSERERLVAQIQKLDEASRQWDTERRQLSDHAGQLQQALTQAQAKIQSYEVAARKPNPVKTQVDDLKRELDETQRENESLQRLLQEKRNAWEAEQRSLSSQIQLLEQQLQRASEKREQANKEAGQRILQEKENAWEAERGRLTSQIEELEQQLQEMSEKREQMSNEVLDQLRQQYEQRLQETLQQKTQLAEELQSARALLQAERAELSETKKGRGPDSSNTKAVEAEISRVEGLLNEILSIIENPNTELSTVIRKNVEKAELDSYLKGILFTLGRK
jgi:chromosome segregation ATPase